MEDWSDYINPDGPAREVLAVGNYARPNFRRSLNAEALAEGKVIFDVADDLDDWGVDEEEEGYDDETNTLFELHQPAEVGGRKKAWGSDFQEDSLTIFDVTDDNIAKFESMECMMENVDDSGLVKKQIIRDGAYTSIPTDGRLYFHYAAFLEGQLEPFDTTLCRKYPQSVDLLETETLLPGLAVAIKSMKIKEAAKFLVDPSLAYGENGCPPRIPPNSRILFIVEALQHIDADRFKNPLFMSAEQRSSLPFSEIHNLCDKLRTEGNLCYKHGDNQGAIRKWRKALNIMEEYPTTGEEDSDNLQSFVVSLYSNLAIGYLRHEAPAQACNACKMGLRLAEGEKKVILLYRFAKAKFMLDSYDAALNLVQEGQSIEPFNAALATLAQQIRKKMNATALIDQQKEKEYCTRMFDNQSIRNAKSGTFKQSEAKPGTSKQSEEKTGTSKQSETKPGTSKTSEAKAGTSKQSEAKPNTTRNGDAMKSTPDDIGGRDFTRSVGNPTQTKNELKTEASATGNGRGAMNMPMTVLNGNVESDFGEDAKRKLVVDSGLFVTNTNAQESQPSNSGKPNVPMGIEESIEKTEEEDDLTALLLALEEIKVRKYARVVSYEELEDEYEDQDEDTPENIYSQDVKPERKSFFPDENQF